MKTKYAAVIAIVVLGLAATLFAVEKQAGDLPPKLILLKSNGETIAELKVLKGATFEVTGGESVYKPSGELTAKGGVTIQIKHAGASPVTVKADEIVVSNAK